MMMKTLNVMAALLCLLATGAEGLAQTTKSQDFSSDPAADGWVGLDNRINGNDYGWSSDSMNNGSLGEAGGTFARLMTNFNSYFGDVDLGGTLTLNDPLRATGRFLFNSDDSGTVDPFMLIGFFNTETAFSNSDGDWLGMTLADNPGTDLRVQSALRFSNNTTVTGTNLSNGPFSSGVSRFFDITYDPSMGFGRLTVTIDEDDDLGNGFLGQNVKDLTDAQRNTIGATFNAFGLVNGEGVASDHGSYQVFIDDLTYTAVGDSPVVAGDYNGDGMVDAADYTVWRDNLGSDASAFATGTRDPGSVGPVQASDYEFWKANFGNPLGAASLGVGSTSIPEPATLWLALFGMSVWTVARRGNRTVA